MCKLYVSLTITPLQDPAVETFTAHLWEYLPKAQEENFESYNYLLTRLKPVTAAKTISTA